MKYEPYKYKFRPTFTPVTPTNALQSRRQQMINRQIAAEEQRRLQEYLLQTQGMQGGVIPSRIRRKQESPMMLSFGQKPNILRQSQMIKRKRTQKTRT